MQNGADSRDNLIGEGRIRRGDGTLKTRGDNWYDTENLVT